MINVKTKSQSRLPVQKVRQHITFQVLSHGARGGSKGWITLAVPKAGKVSAAGGEIKNARVAAGKAGRVTLEVELTAAAKRPQLVSGTRIGLSKGREAERRFGMKDSIFLSKKFPSKPNA